MAKMPALDPSRHCRNENKNKQQQQQDFVEDGTAKNISGTVKSNLNHRGETEMEAYNTSNKKNGSKPKPGCRQFLFNLMRRRLSCELVGDNDNDNSGNGNNSNNNQVDSWFVHQDPCVFCRTLVARPTPSETCDDIILHQNGNSYSDSYNTRGKRKLSSLGRAVERTNGNNETETNSHTALSLLSANDTMVRHILTPFLSTSERTVLFDIEEFRCNFQLENYFCPKHGHKYECDNQILKAAESKINKGGGRNKTGKKKREYVLFADILQEIVRDGKDPIVFRNKLAFRTQVFPPHLAKNKSVNLPEISLSTDPDYGQYFRKMKKCIQCEKEAKIRKRAKKGMAHCRFCDSYYDCSKDRKCGKENCERVLPCPMCRETRGRRDAYECGQCSTEFCSDLHKVHSCTRCARSVCEGCEENLELDFRQCSRCSCEFCSECDVIFCCEICNRSFCRRCRDGGALKGKNGNSICCNECVPQHKCNVCGERKSLECYEEGGKMACSICYVTSCKECAKIYSCEVCEESFCIYCDQPSVLQCKKCRNVVCCSGCGGANSCYTCGQKSSRICSKQNESCSLCYRFFCEQCGLIRSCIGCGLHFCAECIPKKEKSCADCGAYMCDSCEQLEFNIVFKNCQRCGDCYCIGCRTTDRCETCSHHMCSNCTKTCDLSHLSNCKTCLGKLDDFYGQFF